MELHNDRLHSSRYKDLLGIDMNAMGIDLLAYSWPRKTKH